MTNVFHRNDKFLTVHNKNTTLPPSFLVHFATRVRKSRVAHLRRSSRFYVLEAASKMRARNSSRVSNFLLYTSPFLQPHKQKLTELRLGILSVTNQN
jgi:hypothetical protein